MHCAESERDTLPSDAKRFKCSSCPLMQRKRGLSPFGGSNRTTFLLCFLYRFISASVFKLLSCVEERREKKVEKEKAKKIARSGAESEMQVLQ